MLNNIRVAAPCSADWEQMRGDDRVRHCDACNLNVYNLSAFTEAEIRALIANHEGRVCGRLYQRADGTILTQNCPVGVRALTRRLSRVAGAILSIMIPNFAGATSLLPQTYMRTNATDASMMVEVHDIAGGVVPGAQVVLNAGEGHTITVVSDDRGHAIFRVAKAAHYQVTVSRPGFQTDRRTVKLLSGQMLSVPVELRVAVMGDIVEIAPKSQKK